MVDRLRSARVGAPATRALAAVGITRLSQLTARRAVDLLKLHGMGPGAIAILRETLADLGLSIRVDTRAVAGRQLDPAVSG